ncbi:N-(5'-phosphoribosyl)anthranilate isomerase 1, chloroplastic [Porphyridium purpureum]|uniref:phosphoribosylanthranilate isomerase n=1 Tax=Porphyridium purpureum TaxID=35688 RepID=A0A5J4YJA9_PORPP|nr:N-(5'-phosphoribosyl)anthranilate isomerase 1, chloroplastic [Porphyridium purpureum]|eukprot:POR4511..scf291_13
MNARTPLRRLKVCGVVSAEDAALSLDVAARCFGSLRGGVRGAPDEMLIGMILWPHSIRSVKSKTDARAIADAARDRGATPVGVFVDESFEQVEQWVAWTGIDTIQLHGAGVRAAMQTADAVAGSTALNLNMIHVVDVDAQGSAERSSTKQKHEWCLYDAKGGGTGTSFDWSRFRAPPSDVNWMLAGGLTPENVAEAICMLRPPGLDVASGVANQDRCRKDETRLQRFYENVRAAYGAAE